MPFVNQTNEGRVLKMVETLQLILKSAQSNRAEDADVQNMLRPLTDELAGLGAVAAPTVAQDVSQEQRGTWTSKAPHWASVHDMAEQADLKDLTVAMAVYLNRIDEVLPCATVAELPEGRNAPST
ncbi:hypothetical protein [uncultured Aliiroseovarius sp.]|uniref:hypothetical protein n=1 Tax=uncultured Aliiroseovarius sp. TaxID=1658783 RepID=UPI00260D863F|nr:hypothetical protein [uncultured Aliiroseovarius sp.]